jgi:hypothetical protein
MTGATNL